MNKVILSFSVIALVVGAACYAQEPSVELKPASATADEGEKKPDTPNAPEVYKTLDEVIVRATGLYGDWKMVLPEWPGFDTPVTADFCNFKKRNDSVSIVCADGFLQVAPAVTFTGDKLRLRWGGAFNHIIYDAVMDETGTFHGEIIQASMGIVNHRWKANMERVLDQQTAVAPQNSLDAMNNYFDDLASKSIREKYYEDDVYKSMKKAIAKRDYPRVEFAVKYFGKILQEKGHGPTFPDVFKVSTAENNAKQWCVVRIDAEGLADVRCRDIQ